MQFGSSWHKAQLCLLLHIISAGQSATLTWEKNIQKYNLRKFTIFIIGCSSCMLGLFNICQNERPLQKKSGYQIRESQTFMGRGTTRNS